MSTEFQSAPKTSGRRWFRRFGFCLLLIAGGLIAASSVLLVDETEYVIVERFGHIVGVYDRPEMRGLHVKLPWPIDMVRRFDRRIQLFDPPGREIFTRDKKNITVDTYVCWRIAEPGSPEANSVAGTEADLSARPVVRFFRGLGSPEVAQARLDSRVRSVLTTEVGRVELSRLLSIDDSEQGPALGAEALSDSLMEQLADLIREQVAQRTGEEQSLAERLGIEIVDVRIKRINLPLGNQQAVFERMKSERRKIADRYRSAGMAENRVIKSQADRQSNEILAKARADAERIRGTAEAEAISILNRAYAQDPEFYRTLSTLDTYRKILNERTTLILSASSNLLKLMSEGLPDEVPPSEEALPIPDDGDTIQKPLSATAVENPDSAEPVDEEAVPVGGTP